jgi:hypothetical protein
MVDAYSERLAREVDAGVVTNELLVVLDKTVQPSSVGLWVVGGFLDPSAIFPITGHRIFR